MERIDSLNYMEHVALLHKDVYIPTSILDGAKKMLKKMNSYSFSKHFEEHCASSKSNKSHLYNDDNVFETLFDLNTYKDLFEIEITGEGKNWRITKICVRIPFVETINNNIIYSTNQDLCLSLRPNPLWDKVKIITAWLNSKSDAHFTLDNCKYVNEEQFKKLMTEN